MWPSNFFSIEAKAHHMTRRLLIGVIGAGDADDALRKTAADVGAEIARRGWTLVNGGLGGVMEASAKGAGEAGGTTIGILPGTDPAEANPYIDTAIPTGMGDMRNMLIVRASAALVAVGGGLGTLSELALALKAGKPVVGVGTWDISSEIEVVEDGADAVKALEKLIQK